jgi:hypothetical protein
VAAPDWFNLMKQVQSAEVIAERRQTALSSFRTKEAPSLDNFKDFQEPISSTE